MKVIGSHQNGATTCRRHYLHSCCWDSIIRTVTVKTAQPHLPTNHRSSNQVKLTDERRQEQIWLLEGKEKQFSPKWCAVDIIWTHQHLSFSHLDSFSKFLSAATRQVVANQLTETLRLCSSGSKCLHLR